MSNAIAKQQLFNDLNELWSARGFDSAQEIETILRNARERCDQGVDAVTAGLNKIDNKYFIGLASGQQAPAQPEINSVKLMALRKILHNQQIDINPEARRHLAGLETVYLKASATMAALESIETLFADADSLNTSILQTIKTLCVPGIYEDLDAADALRDLSYDLKKILSHADYAEDSAVVTDVAQELTATLQAMATKAHNAEKDALKSDQKAALERICTHVAAEFHKELPPAFVERLLKPSVEYVKKRDAELVSPAGDRIQYDGRVSSSPKNPDLPRPS